MQKTYFTYEELIRSKTATQYNIDNTPDFKSELNIYNVLIPRLNQIRAEWGHPIYVNSGYRCEKLNKKVNGSPTSFHKKGLAVDLTTGSREGNKELFNLIRSKFQFDQLINEQDYSWIHIGYKRDKKEERNLILKM